MNKLFPCAALAAAAFSVWAGPAAGLRDAWSPQEVRTLASMQLQENGPRPLDPSNAYEGNPQAAALGRALFEDPRFSRNGKVSCASCHAAKDQFQDGRPLGQGVSTGKRRTMPVMGAAHSPFLFWDGRKDSLWSQALGPLEDPAEHGGNREAYVQLMKTHYAQQYRTVFGEFAETNRVFANMGKAIAAYERQVSYGESRFDRYAAATAAGDAKGQEVLTPQEVCGLRLFVGKAQCVTCHNGPMFTDHAFHNTGVPPLDRSAPDRGRADAIAKLVRDEFNCLGSYSDAKPGQCGELQFLSTNDPGQLGAFRTPSLRNVADRAPYMHAGQFATVQQAVEHYARSPKAAIGHSELAQPGERHAQRQVIRLTESDVRDLVAFLGTLSGPVIQPK